MVQGWEGMMMVEKHEARERVDEKQREKVFQLGGESKNRNWRESCGMIFFPKFYFLQNWKGMYRFVSLEVILMEFLSSLTLLSLSLSLLFSWQKSQTILQISLSLCLSWNDPPIVIVLSFAVTKIKEARRNGYKYTVRWKTRLSPVNFSLALSLSESFSQFSKSFFLSKSFDYDVCNVHFTLVLCFYGYPSFPPHHCPSSSSLISSLSLSLTL